jgi:hypothetical protein
MMKDDTRERWVRLPSKGREPHSGLTRGFIYELIRTNQIRTSVIKKEGRLTGVRLIWLPSLMEFIERHAEGPDPVAPAAPSSMRRRADERS